MVFDKISNLKNLIENEPSIDENLSSASKALGSPINSFYEDNLSENHSTFSNQFDTYFICYTDKNQKAKLENLNNITDNFSKFNLLDSNILTVRITSIEIPNFERNTSSFQVSYGEIERPINSINNSGKSSFSIRLDSNLILYNFLNKLANVPYKKIYFPNSKQNIKKIDILVKILNINKFFVFEDIKLLGPSSSLNFSKECDVVKMSYDFIYKKCYYLNENIFKK